MPKDNIDYSNTIIYKIYCIDETITDTYVGHTTNFYVRKHQHKISCNDSKNVLKIYKTIRENGGWCNWNMIEIAKYNCKDSTEARIKEQQHYEELKSTLNSCPPYVDKKKYFCIDCNLQCISPSQFNKHINCKLHSTTKPIKPNEESKQIITCDLNNYGETLSSQIPPQNSPKFICNCCDIKTNNKKDFNKHTLTSKHKKLTHVNTTEVICPKNSENPIVYTCKHCNKEYKSRVGLWKHNKQCIGKDDDNYYEGINIKDKDALVLQLLKQNSDLQKLLIEMLNK
jgi:hypothetical protein